MTLFTRFSVGFTLFALISQVPAHGTAQGMDERLDAYSRQLVASCPQSLKNCNEVLIKIAKRTQVGIRYGNDVLDKQTGCSKWVVNGSLAVSATAGAVWTVTTGGSGPVLLALKAFGPLVVTRVGQIIYANLFM